MSMVLFISTIYFQLFEITSSSFVVNENKIVRWENGKKKHGKSSLHQSFRSFGGVAEVVVDLSV